MNDAILAKLTTHEISLVGNSTNEEVFNLARKNKILVPEARKELDQLKGQVMKEKGYPVDIGHPDSVKYEIANEQGIPLNEKYNGHLTSEQAGKIGGPIGGHMVKEMIKMAQDQLSQKQD